MATGNANSNARPRLAERAEAMWRSYLTGESAGLDRTVRMVRSAFGQLPSEPRCLHTGQVYAGAVGTSEHVGVVTVLGDTANTTARPASTAACGEILVSDRTAELAGLDRRGLESRSLELRGRRAPIDVVVVRIGS